MKSLMDIKLRKNLNKSRNSHGDKRSGPGSPEFVEDLNEINEADLSGIQGQRPSGFLSYFEVMTEFCFFDNVDTVYKQASKDKPHRMIDDMTDYNVSGMNQLDFRGPLDMHEMFIDKLQFFIDSLSLMTDEHINMFTNLITHPNFKLLLLEILKHGETNVRMKSHEILEALTTYFVKWCPSKTVYEFADKSN